jgi:hypothetical protein
MSMTDIYTPKEISDEIRYLLSKGMRITVRFTKKDGTPRSAIVTTNQGLIPRSKLPKYVRSVPAGMVVAFDVEKMDWISFHESQATSFSELY